MLPYIDIFGYQIPGYWLMTMAGILACVLYIFPTNRRGKAGHLPGEDVLYMLLLAVIGAIAGAKVMGTITAIPTWLPVIIQNWDLAWQDPAGTLGLLAGGLVFYGGAIGGFLVVWWYCRRYAISMKTTLGLLTPMIPLFHAFGRIGCFMGGCCYGMEVPWGITFTHALESPDGMPLAAPNGVPLMPIQLFEAGGNLILFVVLAALSRRLARKWLVMPLYIVCYGVMRFVLEFFRGDKIRGVFLLSSSQWISLALIAGVAVLWFTRWRGRADEEPAPVAPSAPAPSAPASGAGHPAEQS